jgi:hypothetical protein
MMRRDRGYQLGKERNKRPGPHRRSSPALCPVRECPPHTLAVPPIGHAPGTATLHGIDTRVTDDLEANG